VTSHALCLVGLLAAAAQPGDPREAARQVLARGRYQTDLPSASRRPSGEATPSDGPSAARSRGPSAPSSGAAAPRIPLPPAILVWALLAGALVVGLAWAARQAIRAGKGADEEPPPLAADPPRPEPRALRIGPLTDVEDLARAGRYGEAIHLLLLHLFAALQRRPATAPAPAHTGREVLSRTRLASEARAALAVLVQAAEAVHFGGRQAGREDYENCLGHYRRFLDSFGRAS
jgi:Domain of unknown function (DUF4129)